MVQKEIDLSANGDAEKPVKLTGRGGKYNFPQAVPPENPEDARRVLSEAMQWYVLGTNKPQNDDEFEDRTLAFFADCIKRGERPTVEKLCLALGHPRSTVHDWETGKGCSPRRTDVIKRAKEVLAAYDAGMVTEGHMNPVPYIFRAKNFYGMRDQQEVVLTPNQPMGAEMPREQLAEKYAETLELPDGVGDSE